MCSVDKSLFFQVGVDVTKPLRMGIQILVAQKPLWIVIRYVKLSDFCYGCSMLGHVLKYYDLFDPQIDEAALQHEEWLWASPLKTKMKSAETRIREERRVYLAFFNGNTWY